MTREELELVIQLAKDACKYLDFTDSFETEKQIRQKNKKAILSVEKFAQTLTQTIKSEA